MLVEVGHKPSQLSTGSLLIHLLGERPGYKATQHLDRKKIHPHGVIPVKILVYYVFTVTCMLLHGH